MKLPLYWLALSCWLTMTQVQAQAPYAGLGSHSAKITVGEIEASIDVHLSRINLLNYQYPSQAKTQLEQIERASEQGLLTQAQAMRLDLLQCYNLLEQGEREAATLRAKLGAAKAKINKFDALIGYFVLCEADALNYFGEQESALPLIDTAIELAHKYHQPQALVNALLLRAMIDTQTDNYNSAMEDLRLALDIYPEALAQAPAWQLSPKAYVLAAMGSLFVSTGDISQAVFYTDKARTDKDVAGKMEHLLFINSAAVTLRNQDENLADVYLAHAKTLLSELANPIDLAQSYSQLAYIDLARDRLNSAEEQITIGINTFSKYKHSIFLARAKRLLAQIRFKQGRDEEALVILEQSIELAKNENQDSDLQDFYAILSQYYASKRDYKLAYDYQLQSFELEKKIAANINQTRFLQFKARVTEQSSLEAQDQGPQHKASQTYLSLQQTYGLIGLGLVLLLLSLMYFIKKEPKLTPLTKTLHNQGNEIDNLLQNAKRGGYPLSLLLLNISDVSLVDLSELQAQLLHTLREQDKLYRHSLEEMIILLPHTSLTGARRVAAQVDSSLQNWQSTTPVNIGVASLQQLESFPQLVKKALLDQLAKKSR